MLATCSAAGTMQKCWRHHSTHLISTLMKWEINEEHFQAKSRDNFQPFCYSGFTYCASLPQAWLRTAVLWRPTTRGRHIPKFLSQAAFILATFALKHEVRMCRSNWRPVWLKISQSTFVCPARFSHQALYLRWATSCVWCGHMTSCFVGWLQQTEKMVFWHGVIRLSSSLDWILQACYIVQHKLDNCNSYTQLHIHIVFSWWDKVQSYSWC